MKFFFLLLALLYWNHSYAGSVDRYDDIQLINEEVSGNIYIPKAFTPNGDGVNDYFYVSGEGIDPDKFEMLIYNRFGNLIFKSVTPFDYWDGYNSDGSLAPTGIYVYKITVYDLDGNRTIYEGTVTLIR